MIVVTPFFLLLGILVFLGDGKQPVVDVIAIAGLVCLFLLLKMRNVAIVSPGRTPSFLWGLLFLYLLIRTLFSDSIGLSVSASLRWVFAYLTFILASSVATSAERVKKITQQCVWFGVIIIGCACVVSFLPLAGRALPSMNLLYPSYGHHHIVNIVMFIFPLVLHAFIAQRSTKNGVFLIVCLAGLLFSFARGAWVISAGYLVYVVLRSSSVVPALRRMMLGIIALLCGVFAFGFFAKTSPLVPQAFERFLLKPSIAESRFPYWQQAWLAIEERPFVGGGPGTFSLLSRRFQHAPRSYSWYAHSFPLELLAEIGVIGALLAASVLGYIMLISSGGPLFHSIALSLVYSLVEINLNFLVVWLLLWYVLGLLWRTQAFEVDRRGSRLTAISMAICVCVYIGSLSATILSIYPDARPYAFYGDPYNAARALKTVSLPGVSQSVLGGIERLFDKDPEVIVALAKSLPVSQADSQKQQSLWLKAISLDPQNVEQIIEGMQSLLRVNQQKGVGAILFQLSTAFLSQDDIRTFASIDFSGDMFVTVYTKEFISDIGTPTTARELLAKAYYFMGLSALVHNSEHTRILWTQSRNLAPQWGHFHVELASLYQYDLSNEWLAKETLQACFIHSSAKKQCQDALEQELPPVGHHIDDIRLIPRTPAHE